MNTVGINTFCLVKRSSGILYHLCDFLITRNTLLKKNHLSTHSMQPFRKSYCINDVPISLTLFTMNVPEYLIQEKLFVSP